MPSYRATDIGELLSVCRLALGTAGTAQLPTEPDRWPGIVGAAVDHGLLGPLHAVASTAGCVPAEVLASIRSGLVAQAACNFQLTDALFEILRSFRAHEIDVLVLKGPAVALIAFEQIAAREFTDLDLLVRAGDLEAAQAALIELGYQQRTHGEPRLLTEKDLEFVRNSDNVLVELHWALTPRSLRFPVDESRLWNSVQTLRFQNETIPTLGPEDTFLGLCVHGSRHGWCSLAWVFDIAQILARKSGMLNWPAVVARCEAAGCTRPLLLAVRLASDLFGVTAPQALSHASSEAPIAELAKGVRSSLVEDRLLSQRDLIALQIQIHDRFWDRVFVAVSVSVPELPRLLPQAASPITCGPLRFITRPLRLLKLYGFAWLRSAILGR